MAIAYLCDNLPQSDTLIAVGAPLRKDGMLFNTALIFKGNELLGIVPKTFVPNYKEFYEKRWFAGADQRFSDTIRYDEIFYDEGASLNGERTFPFTPNLIIEGRMVFALHARYAKICGLIFRRVHSMHQQEQM